MTETTPRPLWAVVAALIAVAFGIVTVFVGGTTLFGPPAAGNIVPFVLWFNFIAGFAYIIAGGGIFLWKRWAARLSAIIAVMTTAVFVALGIFIFLGGAYEPRTIGAMTIRSLVWIVIAVATCRVLGCLPRPKGQSAALITRSD